MWEQLARAEEAERKRLEAEFERELQAILATAPAIPGKASPAIGQAIAQATREIDLDEAKTRVLIDRQLRDAEWAASGPTDYVFCGVIAVGVAEAKKFSTELSSVIGQSERYSLGLQAVAVDAQASPPPWNRAQLGPFPGWPARDALGYHPGTEASRGAPAHPAIENELNLAGPPDVQETVEVCPHRRSESCGSSLPGSRCPT